MFIYGTSQKRESHDYDYEIKNHIISIKFNVSENIILALRIKNYVRILIIKKIFIL